MFLKKLFIRKEFDISFFTNPLENLLSRLDDLSKEQVKSKLKNIIRSIYDEYL